MRDDSTVSVGVAGLGYWGPNLARNFDDLPAAELEWLCDIDEARLATYGTRFPRARVTTRFEELLADPRLDAVAIATPVPTHYRLAKQALVPREDGFVEK